MLLAGLELATVYSTRPTAVVHVVQLTPKLDILPITRKLRSQIFAVPVARGTVPARVRPGTAQLTGLGRGVWTPARWRPACRFRSSPSVPLSMPAPHIVKTHHGSGEQHERVPDLATFPNLTHAFLPPCPTPSCCWTVVAVGFVGAHNVDPEPSLAAVRRAAPSLTSSFVVAPHRTLVSLSSSRSTSPPSLVIACNVDMHPWSRVSRR
ncbi:hypothetical protein AURDEDRAFT_173169 [Auricularia subglabra TFB-10046 SS5]|nr:hypothetical protein AURDEDRAFT_173169 [Auricularia subglabra TFB-10046 SS5]